METERSATDKPVLNVVWPASPLNETDWIRYLLSDFELSERTAAALETAEADTLYIVSANDLRLGGIADGFLAEARLRRGVGLLHLSDEWCGEDYGVYRDFAFVVRTYYGTRLQLPGVLTIPLGWPNGTAAPARPVPASQRKLIWCFFGSLVSSRPDMLAAFRGLDPSLSPLSPPHVCRLPPAEFAEALRQSVFCPAPMGNVMIESWRFYEALENGAIPIVERRRTLDYYRRLLGPHPVPSFASWSKARRFVEAAMASPGELDRLQADVLGWWADCKRQWRVRTAQFIAEGLSDRYRPVLESARFPVGIGRLCWQYAELMRHHSATALGRRFLRMAKRGTFRRSTEGRA